ncbi:hypothetical protein M404DRAFT_1004847 [Pisolithus tinctorius Marx 270]|uniref:Uncharacterized protein n=1 Tax=Pisolithus tinctorius Marx 270 TaxID=870435 RepID=A0A0C3JNU5_PISTI|nr:hypothetical protein M404DRAFT_1004847 [Pisolithus tinctorius Marx 270]
MYWPHTSAEDMQYGFLVVVLGNRDQLQLPPRCGMKDDRESRPDFCTSDNFITRATLGCAWFSHL